MTSPDSTPLPFSVNLWWLAEDEQSELNGGEFPADCDRAAAEAAFLAELLAQCGNDDQGDEVLAGRMIWR